MQTSAFMRCVLKTNTFFALFCMSLLVAAAPEAAAQTAVIEGAASLGSGVSLGTGNGETVVLLSPLYIDADVIFYNSEFPKVEYVIGLQAELTGRVSAGIVPQMRLTTGPKKIMVYGLAGIPFVFAPFVMLGVEVGGGLLWRVFPRVGVFIEVVADLFFIGNDLQDDGMLTQIDANLGIRIPF
jgi:hypothetical protein